MKVIGAAPEGSVYSGGSGHPVPVQAEPTMADGIAVSRPGDRPCRLPRAMRGHLPWRDHLTFRQALSETRIFLTATYSYDRAASTYVGSGPG